MSKSVDAFRTISEVADWLGVQSHVLRFWESKFPQVKPVKRAGGRRYYRPADMLLLGGVRKLLRDDGLTIKGVQKILREEGVAHVSDMSLPLDDDASALLEGDLVTRTPSPAEMTPTPSPTPASSAPVVSIQHGTAALETIADDTNEDDTDEQDNDDAPSGIDHAPIKTLTADGPFADDDEEADAQDIAPTTSTPAVIPPFMRDPEMDAAVLSVEDRSDDVPILTPDYKPDPMEPPVAASSVAVEQISLDFEDSPGPFGAPEQDETPQQTPAGGPDIASEPTQEVLSEPVRTPNPAPTPDPIPEATRAPEPEPIPDAVPDPEPIAETTPVPEPQPEPIREAAAAPESIAGSAPEPALEPDPPLEATPAPEDQPEAAPKPLFQHFAATPDTPEPEGEPLHEMAMPEPEAEPADTDPILDVPTPEAIEEPAPVAILRPRIVDVPDDENIDETGIAPSALTKSAQVDRLSISQRAAIRPLVAQLAALRDQMARAPRDPD